VHERKADAGMNSTLIRKKESWSKRINPILMDGIV
jgi:hypothetical protein